MLATLAGCAVWLCWLNWLVMLDMLDFYAVCGGWIYCLCSLDKLEILPSNYAYAGCLTMLAKLAGWLC
jgi:hypothetical protein